nr:MAG TPA: hypothetical protein [Caudoviricetes sp.]
MIRPIISTELSAASLYASPSAKHTAIQNNGLFIFVSSCFVQTSVYISSFE